MKHTSMSGKILYINDPDGARNEFGREWWSMTFHEDGQRTLRAVCEIEPGVVAPRSVLRDTTITTDAAWYPIDCFTRLHCDGKYLGAGWFRFTEGLAEAEVHTAALGRVQQRWPIKGRVPSFGAHNVTCDVLHCAHVLKSGATLIRPANVFLSNLEHDGCGGPTLNPFQFGIEYLGREKVTVPAGTFEADHYQFLVAGSMPREHPTEHVWCLPDTLVFVKIAVGGYMNATFELVELRQGM
jgi:hypothetical protein